jgi:hypothetical protein
MLVEPSVGNPSTATFDVNSERYDFVAEDIKYREWVVGTQDIAGSLERSVAHRRTGPGLVGGRLMMHISPKELEAWIPRIFLAPAKVGDVWTPGYETKEFDILIQRELVTFKYANVQVASAMFRSTSDLTDEPQLVEMMLTFIGRIEGKGEWPDPIPDAPSDDVLYWLHGDSTLTLNGTEYHMDAFNLLIDNRLTPLFRNSLQPVCTRSQGRIIKFNPRVPLCETNADNLYFTNFDASGQLLFSGDKNLGEDPVESLTQFDFTRLYGTKVTPQTRGRTETFLDLDLESFVDAGDPAMTITNTWPA